MNLPLVCLPLSSINPQPHVRRQHNQIQPWPPPMHVHCHLRHCCPLLLMESLKAAWCMLCNLDGGWLRRPAGGGGDALQAAQPMTKRPFVNNLRFAMNPRAMGTDRQGCWAVCNLPLCSATHPQPRSLHHTPDLSGSNACSPCPCMHLLPNLLSSSNDLTPASPALARHVQDPPQAGCALEGCTCGLS